MIKDEILALVSAAADRTSVPFQIDDLTNYSVQVNFSAGAGDLVGVLSLECSNDYDGQTGTGTWITVTGSQQAVAASADHMWNVYEASYKWVRAQWDYTSGTGNIEMLNVIKEPRNRY